MKQLFLSLIVLLLSFGVVEAAVKEGKVTYDFSYGNVKSLTLVNKNGKIDIDRVVGKRDIVVNVTVKCTANTDEDAMKLLNSISVDKSVNGSDVAVNTVIISNKSIKNILTGADYVVDYSVTVPWGVELNIVNTNGSVSVPNYGDKLTVQTENCNVYLGDIATDFPCILVLKRGMCVLKGAENLNAELDYCQYEFGGLVKSSIKSRNSTGVIDWATVTDLNLVGGSLKIGRTEDIKGSATDCALTIADLGDCFDMQLVRKSLTIENVHFSFDKILINSLWTNVNLAFMKDSGYNLTLQHDKRLKVNLPQDLKLGRLSSSQKKLIIGSGYYGNPARKSNVHLRMNAGTLTIQ